MGCQRIIKKSYCLLLHKMSDWNNELCFRNWRFGEQILIWEQTERIVLHCRNTLARVPICSNCFQICSFCTVANGTPPCLSVCLERKASPHLSARSDCSLHPRPMSVCLSVCLMAIWPLRVDICNCEHVCCYPLISLPFAESSFSLGSKQNDCCYCEGHDDLERGSDVFFDKLSNLLNGG